MRTTLTARARRATAANPTRDRPPPTAPTTPAERHSRPARRFRAASALIACLLSTVATLMTAAPGTAAAAPPPFISGRYVWNQGDPAHLLRPVSTDVCVLTRVSGNFRGGGEGVHLDTSGAYWRLWGTSDQQGVGAGATCYRRDAFTTPSGMARWVSPQTAVAWTHSGNCDNDHHADSWWGDAATFLTGMQGSFAGGGEGGYIDQSVNGFAPSVLHGHACQEGNTYSFEARAFFAGAPNTGRPARFVYPLNGAADRTTTYNAGDNAGVMGLDDFAPQSAVLARTDDAMCYLTAVGGNFRGGGEYVDLSPQIISGVQRWVLSAHSGQTAGFLGLIPAGVMGQAACYARHQ